MTRRPATGRPASEPAAMDGAGALRLAWDGWRATRGGTEAIAQRQRMRLADLVAYARTRSPYYRERYRDLPDRIADASLLPVTDKTALMDRFDQWVADPAIAFAHLRRFVDDPDRIGERYLGRYLVNTTSGTTGTPGIFLQDQRALAVAGAMMARTLTRRTGPGLIWKAVRRGGRIAMVAATGGHFATATAAARLHARPRGAKRALVLPVSTPIPDVARALDRFRPALLTSYPTVAAMLATEAEAGRLDIDPALIALAGEGLPEREYNRIAAAFGAAVVNSYAASECPFLSAGCDQGWLHVNSDWAILEPVDADHRPTPPGEQSHTVLLSNLANRVQPILRYDLGDRVTARVDPCPCGSPLPAIRVQGRAAEALTLTTEHGTGVTIAPLALATAAEATPGVEGFQIEQTGPATLRIRFRVRAGADPDQVWPRLHQRLTGLLIGQGARNTVLERAAEPPQQTPGGKYPAIIPLRPQP